MNLFNLNGLVNIELQWFKVKFCKKKLLQTQGWLKSGPSFKHYQFLFITSPQYMFTFIDFESSLCLDLSLNPPELPDTSFTRSISNPEAVMRRRRQQKLEKKLQQYRSKVFADILMMIMLYSKYVFFFFKNLKWRLVCSGWSSWYWWNAENLWRSSEKRGVFTS